MMCNSESTLTFGEMRQEINKQVSNSMLSILKKNGLPDRTLSLIVKEYYGVQLNSGEVSKYLHSPETINIPIIVISAFCKYFSLTLDELVKLNPNVNTSTSHNESLVLSIPNSEALITNSKSKCFRGYWGDYFTYFMPTQSSGKGFLKGILTLKDVEGIASASFWLDTNEKNEDGSPVYKTYEGVLVHSESADCVYCILSSSEVGELCFLMFRHFHINNHKMECRMGEVLTAAAGSEDRYPTTHRILISRQAISDQDVNRLLPILHLIDSKIFISQNELEQMMCDSSPYKNVLSRVLSNPELKAVPYYEIRENTLRTTMRDMHHGKSSDALPLILDARTRAVACRYNKVSKKADKTVRELLRRWGYYKRKNKID